MSIDGRAVIAAALRRVAPEVDIGALDPRIELREAVELDSMDFLNIVAAIHEATGVDIPESDYPLLATLEGFIAYLESASSTGS